MIRWRRGVGAIALPLALSLALAACSSGPDRVVQAPQLLTPPAPLYPQAARRAAEQGTVVLRVQVLANASIGSVELKSGSGSPRLDAAALESVKKLKVAPARTKSGRAVDGYLVIPFTFKLD